MKRPLREKFEDATEEVPEGPTGKVGEGDLVGAGGFLAVEFSRPIFTFIPGVKQPGYNINSHGVERRLDDIERHTFTIDAISEDVAEFVAQYEAAASNIDYIISDTDLISTEMITERRTYSTFEIVVDIEEEVSI